VLIISFQTSIASHRVKNLYSSAGYLWRDQIIHIGSFPTEATRLRFDEKITLQSPTGRTFSS
jgi:hypothetical protein